MLIIFDDLLDSPVPQEIVVSFKRDLYLVLPDEVNLRQKNVFAGALLWGMNYQIPCRRAFGVAEAAVSQDK